jgi:hypothetical protein
VTVAVLTLALLIVAFGAEVGWLCRVLTGDRQSAASLLRGIPETFWSGVL